MKNGFFGDWPLPKTQKEEWYEEKYSEEIAANL